MDSEKNFSSILPGNIIKADEFYNAQDYDRRKFIKKLMTATAATAIISFPAINSMAANKEYTVQEIIDLILKEIPGAPFQQTVDTLKSGTSDQRVSGIITTMFATVDVIKKAHDLNANFIIAHEPTYYNHTDDTNWVENNEVVKEKQKLLKNFNMAIWRFHDYWHALRPDGISYGFLKNANWLKYNANAETVFVIPETSLREIAEHLKSSLGISKVRVIGELSQRCKSIALLPGAWGGQKQISTVEKDKPDVLVVGEVHEWETAEYIRDARMLGSKTSLIVLGHSVSEEPGMKWLEEWLQPRLEGLKVTHIPSNNPFTFI